MTENKPDIFDRIMHLPGLRVFEPLYKKYKEVLMYLFFGVLTTVVSLVSYFILVYPMHIHVLIANVISWVLAVTFAFFTNRIWVFSAPTKNFADFITQMASFFGGRVMTLIFEEVFIAVFDTALGFNSAIVKLIAQVAVMVLNYVVSKLIVFRKPKDKAE